MPDYDRIEKEIQEIIRKEYREFRISIRENKMFYRQHEIFNIVREQAGQIRLDLDKKYPWNRNDSRDEHMKLETLKSEYITIFMEYAEKYARRLIS